MLEKLIALDKKLFVFLNGLGSETYDDLWLIITGKAIWFPLILTISYLLLKKIGWKNIVIVTLFVLALILICDQSANLFKSTFQRLRPCNDPAINGFIRVVKKSYSFSFFSAHAANSLGSTVFIFILLKRFYRYSYLIFLFPLIFAYSRIYLGVHFPLDIIAGFIFGIITSLLLFSLFIRFEKKYELGIY
jgi:undecaprenyl-diphosphatase